MDFQEDFLRVLKNLKVDHHFRSPQDIILRYEGLVKELAEDGYDDYLVEFDNDLALRNIIKKLLQDENILAHREMNEWKLEIARIDEELKKLFIQGSERNGVDNWWQKGILKNGSGDYAEDIFLMYGIRIDA